MQILPKVSGVDTDAATKLTVTPSRIAWLEYLTILGVFVVIWVHVSAGIMGSANTSFTWWVSHIADSMGRWPVPVFVMSSGYFLLDPTKNYTVIQFYKRRSSRILIPLIFWSLFYIAVQIIERYQGNQPVGWKNLIGPVLLGAPAYHLWYLYMLVGLYLFAPFIRKMVSSCNKQELVFICILLFLFSIFMGIANFFYYGIYDEMTNNSLFIIWFLGYLGYFLAGYLLGRVIDIKIGLYALFSILVVSISLTAIGMYILTDRYSINLGHYFHNPSNPILIIMSISVFLIAKKLLARAPEIKLVASASMSMLGVYVMHPFIITRLSYLGLDAINFNPLIGIPLITVCVFFICLAVCEVIKKIPYVQRII
jgi:surface polysaccharide O-acyltransferase-like enzyme